MLDMDRRTFLGTMAAAMLASRAGAAASIQNIGMQLYTVRTDWRRTSPGRWRRSPRLATRKSSLPGTSRTRRSR